MFKIILYLLLYSSAYAMEFPLDLFYPANGNEIDSIQTPKLYNGSSPKENPNNHSSLDGLNEKLNQVSLSNNISTELHKKGFPYFGTTQKETAAISFLLFAQKIMTTNPDIGNYMETDSPLSILSKHYQEMRTCLNILQSQYPDLLNLKYMSEESIKGFVNKYCFETSQSGSLKISCLDKTYWTQYEKFATD